MMPRIAKSTGTPIVMRRKGRKRRKRRKGRKGRKRGKRKRTNLVGLEHHVPSIPDQEMHMHLCTCRIVNKELPFTKRVGRSV